MRRIISMIAVWCVSMLICAQQTDFQKAAAHFKNAKSASAKVTRTQHKKALANDIVSMGDASIIKPDYVSISTNNGKDKLVMKGCKFTMTISGREHTTDSKKNAQFATFQKVLTCIINGGNTDISSLAGVSVSSSGNDLSITITPEVTNAKKKRRLMFSSFTLVIDKKSSVFKRLRMTERNGNYTDYEFSDFKFAVK